MNKFVVRYDRSRFTQSQNNLIKEALDFAILKHTGQQRASGEPFIIHPIAVAEIVASWGLDHEAIMTALLHDVVEDTDTESAELEQRFGSKVAELVEGLTKLRLSKSPRPSEDSPRLALSNENLGKLLLASTKDYRVMLIKLADRLHNMRTLQHLPREKRLLVARESLQVYAPLANRLGMGMLKGELEDLGFKYSMTEAYADIEKRAEPLIQEAKQYLRTVKKMIVHYLKAEGVNVVSIEARQKHYYSIYKKLLKVEGDMTKIYDLIAVRVIVPNVSACYQALGVVHQYYRPLIYRIKDYVAVPKPNGYQSLHTTVFAEAGRITEIQIRTPEMHEAAEYGLAAHFFYDEHKATKGYMKRKGAYVLPERLKWVQQLSALQQSTGSQLEFVEGAKLELFADRIFVYSPKGDLYDLPEGSTPLDFAFEVHSDVGLRALGARINGKMMPLDTRLENRDVVEIATRREAAPSRDWLGFVVTNHAKNRIRAWFRAESREANMVSGRVALESALHIWGVKRLDDLPKRVVADALDQLHVRSVEDLLTQLGEGALTVKQVIKRLIPDAGKPTEVPVVKRSEPTGKVLIEGDNLPYVLASCCNPAFPEPLLGYVTRGKGVTVHSLGCRNIPVDVERYVSCRWGMAMEAGERIKCQVQVQAIDRIGLILDITGVLARLRMDIHGISTQETEASDGSRGNVWVNFGLEVPDLFMLADVMKKLERLTGVIAVRRLA